MTHIFLFLVAASMALFDHCYFGQNTLVTIIWSRWIVHLKLKLYMTAADPCYETWIYSLQSHRKWRMAVLFKQQTGLWIGSAKPATPETQVIPPCSLTNCSQSWALMPQTKLFPGFWRVPGREYPGISLLFWPPLSPLLVPSFQPIPIPTHPPVCLSFPVLVE